jgi:hypothetical protein
MHITDHPIKIAAMTADCTEPPYCVAVARDNNTITISSTVPAHTGEIKLTVQEFDAAQVAIRDAEDPLDINPLKDAGTALNVEHGEEDYLLIGPDGSKIIFYAHELSAFYNGVRRHEFDEPLRLDTLVGAAAV